jgi:hypothetical protein
MSLGTSNRDGGKTSESGHLRALSKIVSGDIINGLNAVQRAAGVNMSVDIQVGDAFVRRSDGSYAHPVFNDAVYNQVISAADGSNPRRDIVVIYVDYGQTPSTAVSNNTNGVVKIKVVNGTPAGSPVDPNGAAIQSSVGAGNPYTILARVRVPAGQTSISNSLIDDLRTMISNNNNTVSNAALIGGITGDKIDPAAITLGYAQITTSFTTNSLNGAADITGLSVTVIVPPGGRRIRITGWSSSTYGANAAYYYGLQIVEGTTVLSAAINTPSLTVGHVIASFVPTPGSHTYKLRHTSSGASNTTTVAAATAPAFILVD